MQTIAIIGGTGPEGSGLAQRWARAGRRIIIGSRDAARAQRKAEEISREAGYQNVSGAANAEAAAAAEVVVLTVPFPAQAQTLKDLKAALRPGMVLIDATVPLAATVGGRSTRVLGLWQGSAAQQAAELVPKGVMVAAAFQNIGAEILQGTGAVDCDVIVCSDHDEARVAAMQLAALIPGVRAIDGGKLENARTVEQLTALLIAINMRYQTHSAGIRITGLPAQP
ncbi:MAG TPA: NADPH-dependent F420 reductase [Terriglobales bacterium]|nr:NADPH-dependent F420 reductase [Terriglobales bacterium]